MKMSTSRLLGRIRHSPEPALSEIAARLRSGNPDRLLLLALAQMIDPKSNQYPFGVRLDMVRTNGSGQPKKPVNWDLARFIQERVDEGEKKEAAVALAMEKFNVGRTTCFEAHEALRESRKMEQTYHDLVKRYG